MENSKKNLLVLIKGAGEIASAIAHRLVRCGMDVIMTEIATPTCIRRAVSFAQAVFDQEATVEGITAKLATLEQIQADLKQPFSCLDKKNNGRAWVTIASASSILQAIHPLIVVDAILAKQNLGTHKNQASLVIGVGPGLMAGEDVHYCIETMRGHHLGRIISQGQASPDTGIPGDIAGFTHQRVIRAPCAGVFAGNKKIGDCVAAGDIIGYIQNSQNITTTVNAPLTGVLRGIIQSGISCTANLKIGDVDPRGVADYCFQISDKARNIAGSVLEVIIRHFPVTLE